MPWELFAIFASVILGITAQPLLQHWWHIFQGYVLHPEQGDETVKGAYKSKLGAIVAFIIMLLCIVIIVFATVMSVDAQNARDEKLINAIHGDTETILKAIHELGGKIDGTTTQPK